mgnify:FL=1
MKLVNKVVGTVLACTMAVSLLAACGSDTAGTNGKELIIGASGPLTGNTASYGQAVQKGAQLAVDEINAAGGVNGITLKLDFQDDENNAQKVNNAYNIVKDNGAKVFMGTVTSGPCVSVVELAQEDNMFMITPSGTAVDCIKYDNAFRVCFNDPMQGTASAEYIATKQLGSKIGIIYDSSDVYSSGIFQAFKAEAANRGLEIVSEQAFTSSNNTDFSVALQKIKESNADLVFLPIYYKEASSILQQARDAGLSVKWFGCDGLDGVIGQLQDDAALAEGVMLLTPYAADSKEEKSAKFTQAYKDKYNGETPIQFAADAYDAIYAIKAAIEKAGIEDVSMSISDLCDQLKVAMTEITLEGVTGTITWSADGEPSKETKVMVIQNGGYTAMD